MLKGAPSRLGAGGGGVCGSTVTWGPKSFFIGTGFRVTAKEKVY